MKALVSTALVGLTLLSFGVSSTYAATDAQIKKKIIQESISNYPGPCACPYNAARNGSRCGKRSAYSRSGGYDTLCFDKDVKPEMIKEYRERTGSR